MACPLQQPEAEGLWAAAEMEGMCSVYAGADYGAQDAQVGGGSRGYLNQPLDAGIRPLQQVLAQHDRACTGGTEKAAAPRLHGFSARGLRQQVPAGSPAFSSGGGAAQSSIAAREQQLAEEQAIRAGCNEIEEQLRQLRKLDAQLWQRDLSLSRWEHKQMQQPRQQRQQPSCRGVPATGAGGAAACSSAAAEEGNSGDSGDMDRPADQGKKGQEGPAKA